VARSPASRDRAEATVKPGGGVRWITHLAPDRDRLYRRLVEPLVPTIERSLGPGVIANRALDAASSLVSPRIARRRWRAALAHALTPGAFAIVSDVRDCYGSIGLPAVRAGLARAGTECPDDLETFLRATALRGLPVGPEPSAVLANAVLAVADDDAAAAGVVIVRWVDDVVIAGADRLAALAGFEAWRSTLAALGLVPNEDKTGSVADAVRAARLLLGSPASGTGGALRGIIRWP
jgi:hypothetical protein